MMKYRWSGKKRRRLSLKSRSVLRALAAGALLVGFSVGLPAAEVFISHPSVNGQRIDICLEWGSGCNGEAAESFCKAKGFNRMIAWKPDPDIGATHPTLVLGSGQVCDEAFCDGYASITCAREDDWTASTGHGGLLVEVVRDSNQSPEGILVVAVSETDVRQVAAVMIDVLGLGLLHTPPGKYRLLLNNYLNSNPLPPTPAFPVEAPPGRQGEYTTIAID